MKSFFFVAAVIASSQVFGASLFKGYPKKQNEQSVEVKGRIVRMEESKSQFLIGIEKKNAFYLYPKVKNEETSVRDFLQNRKSKRTPITLQVNPKNTEIYFLKAEK